MQSTKVKMAVALVAVMVALAVPNYTINGDSETVTTTAVTVAKPTPQPQVTEIAKVEEPPKPKVEVKTAEQKKLEEKQDNIKAVAVMMQGYREEPGSSGVKLNDATAQKYAKAFIDACEEYKVPLYTALGMGWYESGFDKKEVSSCGAVGIMQVMPGTAKKYGVSREELFNPLVNIKTGVHYLADLKYSSGCSWDTAIRGYNQGLPRAIAKPSRGGSYLKIVRKHSTNMKNAVGN
jgi:membrane-bound lytic murein transglycosylase B